MILIRLNVYSSQVVVAVHTCTKVLHIFFLSDFLENTRKKYLEIFSRYFDTNTKVNYLAKFLQKNSGHGSPDTEKLTIFYGNLTSHFSQAAKPGLGAIPCTD